MCASASTCPRARLVHISNTCCTHCMRPHVIALQSRLCFDGGFGRESGLCLSTPQAITSVHDGCGLQQALRLMRKRDALGAQVRIISEYRTQTSLSEGCNAILRHDCVNLAQVLPCPSERKRAQQGPGASAHASAAIAWPEHLWKLPMILSSDQASRIWVVVDRAAVTRLNNV